MLTRPIWLRLVLVSTFAASLTTFVPVANADCVDTDSDGICDDEDLDDDDDGLLDTEETDCGSDPLDQASVCETCNGSDDDGDGEVDEGLADDDGDGLCNEEDNCPSMVNADQANLDGDGSGDVCDVCACVSDGQQDHDGDGAGDACDLLFDVPVGVCVGGTPGPDGNVVCLPFGELPQACI